MGFEWRCAVQMIHPSIADARELDPASARETLAQLFGVAETKAKISPRHQFAIILACGALSWLPVLAVISWIK